MKMRSTRSSISSNDWSSRGGRGGWRSGTTVTSNASDAPATTAEVIGNSSQMDYYQSKMTPAEMKMDVSGNGEGNDSMETTEKPEGNERKRPWEKPGVAGTKIKKKKVPGAKNLKIRRYVQPKNAVMCLNELKPGVTYVTEQEGGVGQPFCVSVEVDGQKYRGFGSSKQLAKQATAEAALISFVKPPPATSENAHEEDKTPWATLASFAIFKLFNEWREGRVGLCPPATHPYGAALPPGFQAFLGQAVAGQKIETTNIANAIPQFTDAIAAHLGGKATTNAAETKSSGNKQNGILPNDQADVKVPNPAKIVPENAITMHPVMVLHQMKPAIAYIINQATQNNKPFFNISADCDGQTFYGEGSNVKKAKFHLAKEAIKVLYQVNSTFEVVV